MNRCGIPAPPDYETAGHRRVNETMDIVVDPLDGSHGVARPGFAERLVSYNFRPAIDDSTRIRFMSKLIRSLLLPVLLVLPFAGVQADEYQDALQVFKSAGESSHFIENSYGYALFPTITKAGFIIGGGYGEGRVYEQGRYIGDTSMTQGSIGLQLGGQAFSQIIFFRDKRALSEFTSGNFEFGAEASAVGIRAGASAQTTTTGSSTSTSRGQGRANTKSRGYYKGMAIFTVAKGGLMFQATVGGQKFRYQPRR